MTQDRPHAAVVTPFLADRDAVSTDAHRAAELLRRRGWDARMFAVGGQRERERIHPLSELREFARAPEDLVYLHFSTGRQEVTQAVAALRCRKVFKYHNVTPPEMFSMWSDELAEASRTGRVELPNVAGLGWEMVWGDSSFNLSEIAPLLAPGTRTGVLPPFHETEALLALRPQQRAGGGPARLLAVGRVAQSKGHPFLLRILRYLVHELHTPATLEIVGKPDHRLQAYSRMLELMVREFGLEAHVRFLGEISNEALAARYAEADVFISTSEHEGFCVPVVEAMAFGVPVVALGVAAVPETVGDAGIVWSKRDPRLFAVTLQRLLRAPAEREWLGELGRRRFAERFTNARIEAMMAAALRLADPAAVPSLT